MHTDDDAPPLLESLAEQVLALVEGTGVPVKQAVAGASEGDTQAAALPAACIHAVTAEGVTRLATALGGAAAATPTAKPAIRKGFFNARQSGGGNFGSTKPQKGQPATSDVPLLRTRPPASGTAHAGKGGSGSGAAAVKPIPDFLILPPDARTAARDRLVGALAPTPDTLTKVAANPVLAAGFDDPEVMAAVSEVAADPSSIIKHQGNAKVMRFYAAMGQLVGSKLEQLGEGSGGASSRGGSGDSEAAAVQSGVGSGAGAEALHVQATGTRAKPPSAGRPGTLSDLITSDKAARQQAAAGIRWRE